MTVFVLRNNDYSQTITCNGEYDKRSFTLKSTKYFFLSCVIKVLAVNGYYGSN